jgi:hypothetical protein
VRLIAYPVIDRLQGVADYDKGLLIKMLNKSLELSDFPEGDTA